MHWGTLRIRLAAPLLFVAPLAAQAGPPAYVPPVPPMLNVRVSEVPALVAAWPKMRIYGLLEEYGLTEAIARGARSMVPDAERLRAVREAAQRAGFDLGAYEVANLMRVNGPQLPPGARPEDIRQFALLTHLWRGENGSPRTAQLAVTSCVPRAQGRWARIYGDEIRWWRECGWFQPVEGVKIDGLPVAAFALSEAQQQEIRESSYAASNRWFAQAPGSFVIASGPLDQIGRFEMAPPADAPGMHFEANVDAVREGEAGRMASGEELLLGAARSFRLDLQLEGDVVREQVEVVLSPADGKPSLANALLSADGPLVAQALPDGAMVQLRCRLDLKELYEVFDQLGVLRPAPLPMVDKLPALLDGSLSLGLCAPAPGGVIPQVYLTLGVTDGDGLRELLAAWRDGGLPLAEVTYDGVECLVLKLPDLPQGLSVTLCQQGDKLHVAESGRSMRQFLKEQRDGVVAMQLDDAMVPTAVPGEPIRTLELRMDPARAYEAFYELWLPLLMMTAPSRGGLSRDDLPEPRDAAEYLRPVQVAFFRDGDRIGMHSVGVVGGPVGIVYSSLIGIMAEPPPSATGPLEDKLREHKLRQVGEAIARFVGREGRTPKDLAELFAAEALPDDALVVPGDEQMDALSLPGGREVRAAFRYFAEPVTVSVFGRDLEVRLAAIQQGNRRLVLTAAGQVEHVYQEAAQQPIDRFGK